MGVKVSEMATDTTIAGTEKLVSLDGSTSKVITTAKMAEYAIDTLYAAASATPTTGDTIVAFRGTDEKKLGLDAVSTYVHADMIADFATVTALNSSDKVIMQRSSAGQQATVETLADHILSTYVIDLGAAPATSLSSDDEFLVFEDGTATLCTLSALETKLWTDYAAYVNGLAAVSSAADTDVFYTIQGGTPKYVTNTTLAAYLLAEIGPSIVDDTWDDAAVVTSTSDSDVYVLERSGARKSVAAQYIAAYVLSNFASKSAVTPAADGDKVAMWRGSTPGTLTVDVIASYAQQTIVDDWATVTPAAGTDKVLINRSSAGKQVLLSDVKTYVLTDIQDTVLDSATITSTASPTTTDVLFLDRSGTPRSCTLANLETKLWTDFATYAGSLADAGTLADANKFYVLQSGVAKYCTALEIATYVAAEIWGFTSATLAGTDKVFVYSGSANKTTTLDDIATYVMTGAQDEILDISGLTEASGVASTDQMLLVQGGTPYYIELGDVAAEVTDTLPDYIAALGAVTTLADDDTIMCLQSVTPKNARMSDVYSYISDELTENFPWKPITYTKYDDTPSSPYKTLSMTDTSDMAVGLPIKFDRGGSTYYAIVTEVVTNTSITIAGAPMSATISNLFVGLPSQVHQAKFWVDTAWGGSIQDIFADVTKERHRWNLGKAYLVSFAATSGVADTGASEPKLNVKIDGSLVSTYDSNNGIQLSGTAGTWTDNDAVSVNTTNYVVNRGDAIDLRCTAAGTNGDADCLSVELLFVFE
jgi:hypothetical protein